MFNRFMITAATAALIAGTGFAYAQGNMGREAPAGGAGMQQSAPSSPSAGGAASHAGSAGMKSSQSEEKGGAANRSAQHEMKSGAEKGTVGQSAGEKEKSAQESGKGEKSRSMSSQNERGAAGKDMKAEDQQRNGNMKAQGKERNDNMKAEGQQRNGNTKAEGPNNMNTGANTAGQGRSQTTGQAGAGARLSTEQRTRITSIIRDQHVAPVNNVNFAVSVGTRVPVGIGFHPLPADIVSIYPDWRGYEFFLAHDQIVVVDPRTLEIVAVLEA